MRPILWAVILTFMGGIFWVIFSVIYGVGLGLGAPTNPMLQAFVYIFGVMFFFSFPVGIGLEIINWMKHRRYKNQILVNPPE